MKARGDNLERYTQQLEGSLLKGQPSARQELVDGVFHAFVNLMIELLALTLAFIFFLTHQSSKELWRLAQSSVVDESLPTIAEVTRKQLEGVCSRLSKSDCCTGRRDIGQSPVLAATSTILSVLDSLRDPDPARNATATQNLWVMRTAVMYTAFVGVILFVLFVSLKLGGGRIRTNLGKILVYNLVLLAVTFAVQIAFMYFVTLRYIPSKASDRRRLILDNLDSAFDRASENQSKPTSPPEGLLTNPSVLQEIAPKDALMANVITVAIVICVAIVVFFTWRTRAFQRVSFFQSILAQTLFISFTMAVMYFVLKDRVLAKVEGATIRDLVQGIADKAVKLPSGGAAEVQSAIRNVLESEGVEESDARADKVVDSKNNKVVTSLVVTLAVGTLVCMVLFFMTTRRLRKEHGAKALLMIALVGAVGATTSALVEWGFGNNVLVNYRPLNVGQFTNYWIDTASVTIKQEADDFCTL
jgi:hypothetical protein